MIHGLTPLPTHGPDSNNNHTPGSNTTSTGAVSDAERVALHPPIGRHFLQPRRPTGFADDPDLEREAERVRARTSGYLRVVRRARSVPIRAGTPAPIHS